MAGIGEFLTSLKETEWDVLIQVMHDLQDSTSPDRMESLRQFLQSLVREIDAINKKRDALGQKVENVEVLLPIVEEHLKHGPSMELDLFKSLLCSWRSSLKTEINETRPSGKLEKKHDTERKRDFLLQLQSLTASMSKVVLDTKRPEKVRSVPPASMVPPEPTKVR